MKKKICLGIFFGLFIMTSSAFSQSNDEKAIVFLDTHLQKMFKVLNSKPQIISPTCMDSLKKLHEFKEINLKEKNDSDIQREVDAAILRALYANSIQFCGTDVQTICSRRAEPSVRSVCKEMSVQN